MTLIDRKTGNSGRIGEGNLAKRLGMTVHQSLLDRRIQQLMREYGSGDYVSPEDWLMALAHARGAHVVQGTQGVNCEFVAPPDTEFPNEELVVAICALQRDDRPQLLRLAAQLVSRGAVNVSRLLLVARRERADVVLGELARQALKVEPDHSVWRQIGAAFRSCKELRSPILHWQRLAWPVMQSRRANAQAWRLVR